MHPSQLELLRRANSLTERLAATNLWKYVCPDTGKDFWLSEKLMTIRSPWTGKTFTTKPERSTLTSIGQELREEAKTAANVLWKYTCPDTSKEFWLQDRVRTIRSPFTAKTFAAKPEKATLGDVGQELREEAKAKMAADGLRPSEVLLQSFRRMPEIARAEVTDTWHDGFVRMELLLSPREAQEFRFVNFHANRGYNSGWKIPNFRRIMQAVRRLVDGSGLYVENIAGPQTKMSYVPALDKARGEKPERYFLGNTIVVEVYDRTEGK